MRYLMYNKNNGMWDMMYEKSYTVCMMYEKSYTVCIYIYIYKYGI